MFVLDQAIKDTPSRLFENIQTREDLKIANLATSASSTLSNALFKST